MHTEVIYRTPGPDAPVRVGHTTDDQVVVLLSAAAAETLAKVLVRFDHEQKTPGDRVALGFDFDPEQWIHAAIDLLASAAHATTQLPVPIMAVGCSDFFGARA